jgi:hypothetical protein
MAWVSLVVLSLSMIVVSAAQADVLVQEKTSSSGIMGMGASEGQSTIIISGLKQQTEREINIKGMPGGMGGDGPMVSVDIIRLDKELIWNLDMNKKEYNELTFAAMKELLSGSGKESSGKSGKAVTPEDIEFSVRVESPGAKKEINGFATEQKILRIEGKSAGGESEGAMGQIRITADMWLAKDVPGIEELNGFKRSFAEKVGIAPSLFQSAGGMAQMMGGSIGRLADEMQKLEGYPILMVMTIETPQMGAGRHEEGRRGRQGGRHGGGPEDDGRHAKERGKSRRQAGSPTFGRQEQHGDYRSPRGAEDQHHGRAQGELRHPRGLQQGGPADSAPDAELQIGRPGGRATNPGAAGEIGLKFCPWKHQGALVRDSYVSSANS